MSARLALVQRPRRKAHLAALEASLWLSLCDRVALPEADTAVTELEAAIGTIDDHAAEVCTDCRRLILFAGYVGRDRVAALLASLARAA